TAAADRLRAGVGAELVSLDGAALVPTAGLWRSGALGADRGDSSRGNLCGLAAADDCRGGNARFRVVAAGGGADRRRGAAGFVDHLYVAGVLFPRSRGASLSWCIDAAGRGEQALAFDSPAGAPPMNLQERETRDIPN